MRPQQPLPRQNPSLRFKYEDGTPLSRVGLTTVDGEKYGTAAIRINNFVIISSRKPMYEEYISIEVFFIDQGKINTLKGRNFMDARDSATIFTHLQDPWQVCVEIIPNEKTKLKLIVGKDIKKSIVVEKFLAAERDEEQLLRHEEQRTAAQPQPQLGTAARPELASSQRSSVEHPNPNQQGALRKQLKESSERVSELAEKMKLMKQGLRKLEEQNAAINRENLLLKKREEENRAKVKEIQENTERSLRMQERKIAEGKKELQLELLRRSLPFITSPNLMAKLMIEGNVLRLTEGEPAELEGKDVLMGPQNSFTIRRIELSGANMGIGVKRNDICFRYTNKGAIIRNNTDFIKAEGGGYQNNCTVTVRVTEEGRIEWLVEGKLAASHETNIGGWCPYVLLTSLKQSLYW